MKHWSKLHYNRGTPLGGGGVLCIWQQDHHSVTDMSARLRPLTDFLISGLHFCLSKSSFSVLQTDGKVLNGVTIKIVS